MQKKELLAHWVKIEPKQDIKITAIPYKHSGSTYDCDGIRLTGTQEFIDSVLSHLKPLLSHENGSTRLQVSYQESTDKDTRQPTGSYCCYIQVHHRGREAKMINAVFGLGTDYQQVIGG